MGAEGADGLAAGPGEERASLEARWLHLTRSVLPGMARGHGWPIRDDHCFMRVCLDGALGRPWRELVQPPAYRNLSAVALAQAVALAESVVANPALLPKLNADSIRMRRGCTDAPTLLL